MTEQQGSKLKTLTLINCTDSFSSNFTDDKVGPFRPGFYFYFWLRKESGLKLNIPETLLIDRSIVTRFYNDSKGSISSSPVDMEDENSKTNLVANYMLYCTLSSSSFLDIHSKSMKLPKRQPIPKLNVSPASSEKHKTFEYLIQNDNNMVEPLVNQVVAIKKKPLWKSRIQNQHQILTPYPLQAAMQSALEGGSDVSLIQKFVKPKGKRAGFYRVFWKRDPSSFSTVAGYHICNLDEFKPLVDANDVKLNCMLLSKKLLQAYGIETHISFAGNEHSEGGYKYFIYVTIIFNNFTYMLMYLYVYDHCGRIKVNNVFFYF
jgi:hypothetical protein